MPVRVPRLRPTSALLAVAFATLVTACAPLGPRIQGHDDVVEWRATDLRLERGTEGQRLWTYSFNLVIRELRGTSVTFDQISIAIYQPGVTPYTARYRGAWKLGPKDEFRIPLSATIYCQGVPGTCGSSYAPIPLWQVVMLGKDGRSGRQDRDRPVASGGPAGDSPGHVDVRS